MIKLLFSRSVFAIALILVGSDAMEVPKSKGKSIIQNHEVSVQGENKTQPETMTISQERVNTLLTYFNKDRFCKIFCLSELKKALEPNSTLAEGIKAISRRKISDATDMEIRCAMESLYMEKRIFEVYKGHKFYCFFMRYRGKEQMPLSQLESLIASNSTIPEDIKALARRALPDVSDEEIRRAIEIIYFEITSAQSTIFPSEKA